MREESTRRQAGHTLFPFLDVTLTSGLKPSSIRLVVSYSIEIAAGQSLDRQILGFATATIAPQLPVAGDAIASFTSSSGAEQVAHRVHPVDNSVWGGVLAVDKAQVAYESVHLANKLSIWAHNNLTLRPVRRPGVTSGSTRPELQAPGGSWWGCSTGKGRRLDVGVEAP